MAFYAQKDPDLQATEKIYRKIMSTGRDTGRFSTASPSPSVGGRKSGHPTPRRYGATPIKPGHSTPRGGVVLGEKNMNRHFPDPGEALKRTHDGVTTHRNVSPTSTVRTGQSSKKRAVSNQTPVKSSTGSTRKDKHLTGIPCEKKFLEGVTSDRWNLSYQALRLEKEWTELDQCRNMKRNSEIVQHRIDNMYMMSGSGIRLKPKYDINESELQQLKDLSRARQVLRDKSKKNQPSSKGRQTNTSGRQSSKSVKNDGSHPEIHIHGDSKKDGTNGENPSQADWASDPGSRPNPSPRSPPGNHGDAITDEAGRIINQSEKDANKVAEDVDTEEGDKNKENVGEDHKGEGQEGVDNEGQEGEEVLADGNLGDGRELGEEEPVEESQTVEDKVADGTESVKDGGDKVDKEEDVEKKDENNVDKDEENNVENDVNENGGVKCENVNPDDTVETENRTDKENEENTENGDLKEGQTAETSNVK